MPAHAIIFDEVKGELKKEISEYNMAKSKETIAVQSLDCII